MGFKADVSFLQKLTMGAAATRFAIDFLRQAGFSPIELERYCTSNKIWMTKVKRLRLADVLCVETGLRVEIRGKSDLSIRMSESPKNPDRRWDAGLRDADLICLVACDSGDDVRVRCAEPTFFSVADMRATVDLAKLGPPKSAGEGAERDLEWPSTVPSQDGEVVELTPERIVAVMRSGRRQSYQLKGKTPYVKQGDRFTANVTILAGVVAPPVDVRRLRNRVWNPSDDLRAPAATDRYAAAKALVARGLANRHSTIKALASVDTQKRPVMDT